MDGQIKVGFGDEDMMHFQGLASPAKSDGSSVDIYDGLDMANSPEQAPEKSNPSKNCLDLYEEILTEEGTAKEASFSELSDEYEKCQRQIKQLVIKLKQTQSLNSSLQNENQCLKKNISALIKTARVEITRKEEEINALNRRLGASGKNHSFHPPPLLNINKSKPSDDNLSKNLNTENLPKKALTFSQTIDIASRYSKNLCDKRKTCTENKQLCSTINHVDKHCKDRPVDQSQEQTLEPLRLEVKDKNRNEMCLGSRDKETERTLRKRPKSSIAISVKEGVDVKEKTHQLPAKSGKNESFQENKNSKSEVGCEKENPKYHSSSTKGKKQLKDPDYCKEKVKRYESSPHRRESRAYDKEKNTESKHRAAEKNEEPRRSKRTHFSSPKDDGSHKISELSDSKRRSSDVERKDRHSSEYRESKIGNKDLKPNKSEHSTMSKPNRENKSERSDHDRKTEKKRSRDEQDRVRHDQKDKVHQKKEKGVHLSSSKDKTLHSSVSEKNEPSEKANEVNSSQKDFKLSFMETLNLTLSPAKKTLPDTQVLSSAPSTECEECEVEGKLAKDSSPRCGSENHAESLHSQETDLRPSELLMDNHTNKVFNVEESKLESYSGPMCLNEQPPNSAVDENRMLLAKLTIEDKPVELTVLSEVSSREMDTHTVGDCSHLIDLDSFIELDRCSGSPNSEAPDVSEPAEQIQDNGSILEKCEEKGNKIIELTSNAAETPKELLPETNSKSTNLSVSGELNKENCQPDNKSDLSSKNLALTSDDLEEGEILSEDEQTCQQKVWTVNSPSQVAPEQVMSVTKSHSGHGNDIVPLSKTDTLIIPEKSAIKHKGKIDIQPKLSEFPTKKRKKLNAESCLDGILKIVTPSSIQDVLQMLRTIRKHIRKKYMKFKVQFSLTQFQRVIEVGTLYFLTLVKSLDWSNLCSSSERLQRKLCKHIDSTLKKLKKNEIVDGIFEQHLTDMKKRLWKFVEEEFDSLFDILKSVILKLCDKAEMKNNLERCENIQKFDPVKSPSNKRIKLADKVCLSSSGSVPCVKQLELHSQARLSNPKTQNDNGSAMRKDEVKALARIDLKSKNVDISSSNGNLASKLPHLSPAKTSTSDKLCPESQLNSSGLSFNLVSDDHMGEVFKSLLHNADSLPPDLLPESMWILDTPDKTVSSSQKLDNVNSRSENKSPTKAGFSWCALSPQHVPAFPMLETVLNPDVFDESCLLEIPTSVSSSKTLNGSEDRPKCYSSSVLMEDLAVSLTFPSPLKSDSDLSFLRPLCDTEPVSEVDIKCSERSVLDEEDAIVQDLHLTLDSDNSSNGSLEDPGELGSFQYHPSEPMQAVIMEKSNDHFIVKIRRAVSSSSPVCECPSEGADIAAPESLQTVDSSKVEMETRLDMPSEAHMGGILPHAVNFDLANVTENNTIDAESAVEIPLLSKENESDFKLPPSRNQPLEIQAETKLTPNDIVEHFEIDCEKKVTNCIEETCSNVTADILPMKISDTNTVDLNLNKKRKESLAEEPSTKRQKMLFPDKDKGIKPNESEDLQQETSNKKKHKSAVSDETTNFRSFQISPTSLSAKNVIKKKGEVVISWTRDEDRAILLKCQKHGPTKKTFVFLSSTMNKYPHQVEERFRQLMKLFKKSRNSSC
ncbi:CASP8-associated protein 2 isoform 2-T2 [Leptodactylus fuscus]|uniref:CASP8-associated protein 2 isoform X2 n=1 Tax=Leptodactylus fuscus TaxID=238119 RepID=UPI003F4F380B